MLDGGWTRPRGGIRRGRLVFHEKRRFWILHLGCINGVRWAALEWAASNHGHVGEDSDGVVGGAQGQGRRPGRAARAPGAGLQEVTELRYTQSSISNLYKYIPFSWTMVYEP